jgi:hypothetical protein
MVAAAVLVVAAGWHATCLGAAEPKPIEPVTSVGEYKFYEGHLTVAVSEDKAGVLQLCVTRTSTRPGKPAESYRSEVQMPKWLQKREPWFIYPESADRVWLFNGKDDLLLHETTDTTSKTIEAGPSIVKTAPQTVRSRLPKGFVEGLERKQ